MRDKSVVWNGVIAGLIGGASVALWFLVVDLIEGRLFYTPTVLGGALLSLFGPADDSAAVRFIAYTVFHFASFALIGIVANAFLQAGDRQPSVLIAFLILFVAFEVAFYGFTALLAQSDLLGDLVWYQIGLANLFAALTMGLYLRRAHPMAGRNLSFALRGGTDSA